MLKAEAKWIADQLEGIPSQELSPLLSVGSGATELRKAQPWLDEVVYEPLEQRGVRVLHHELQPAPGVDVAGDLTDPGFLLRLDALDVRSIMCCNVLEHVPDPAHVAARLEALVAPGAYLIVSVPRRYPYHPGPIDTLYRPDADELARLFPQLERWAGGEIRCESLLGYFVSSRPSPASLARGLRSLARGGDGDSRAGEVPLQQRLRMAFFSTAVSAVILRRQS